MNISMDKKYTLEGEVFTVLTVTKPGKRRVVGYTPGGQIYSLFFDGTDDDLCLVEINPYADFVIDEPVMVRDFSGDQWQRGHFAGCREDGLPQTFFRNESLWTKKGRISEWQQCRRPTAEELAT